MGSRLLFLDRSEGKNPIYTFLTKSGGEIWEKLSHKIEREMKNCNRLCNAGMLYCFHKIERGGGLCMQGGAWGNEYRTTIVCVDEYQNSVLSGRLYHPYLPEGDSFHSLMEFFRKMEDLLDGMQFPQSFTAVRSFSDPPMRAGRPPGADVREGRCATFAVRVLFRQNASWQGSVSWLEGSREESFRSALELAFLMDSALMAKGSLPTDSGPTSQLKTSKERLEKTVKTHTFGK